MPGTLETLQERTFSDSGLRVDREGGVISSVKVLGRESKNGREYSKRAMESASRLYSDATVNLNHPDRRHPDRERGFEEGVGWLQDCKVMTDGVYADLHLLKEHPQFGTICEAAERSPRRFGLSHNASGETVYRDGKTIVEDVEAVYSVDIVRSPATNSGLFESSNPMPKKTTLKNLVETAAKDRKGFKRALSLIEQEEPGLAMDPAMEVDPEADAAEAVVEKLADKAKEVFKDPKIDPKETGKKVAELAKAADDVKKKLDSTDAAGAGEGEGEGGGESEGGGSGDDDAMESVLKKMNRLEAKNMLLEAGVEATDARISAVAAIPESARKELVESWPVESQSNGEASVRPKPRSGSVLTESVDSEYADRWKAGLEKART